MITPTLSSAVRRSIAERLREVNTCIPARVESFDRANRTITAQPLVKVAYQDETGARQTEALAAVPRVPVGFVGAPGRGMTFPLRKGDTVLLLISQASIDRWFARGGIVDPGDDRHHALSDAIAYPGVMDEPTALGEDPVHETATVISGEEIHAGGTQELALNADLEGLRLALAALTTGTTAPVGSAALACSGRTVPFTGTAVLKGG